MRPIALLTAFVLLCQAQQQQEPPRFGTPDVKISVTTNLVVINVDVRDRSGKPIESLKASDFELTEDGTRQKLSVFEFQRLATEPQSSEVPASATAPAQAAVAGVRRAIAPSSPGQVRYRDRRLLVLFLDFSSMPQEDQIRAQTAALKFIDHQITPADMVSIMTFSNKLQVVEDFTNDRERLR